MKIEDYKKREFWQEVNFIPIGSELWYELNDIIEDEENEERLENLQLEYYDVADGIILNDTHFSSTPYRRDHFITNTNDGMYELSEDFIGDYKVSRKITFDEVKQAFEDDPTQELSFDMIALKLEMAGVI